MMASFRRCEYCEKMHSGTYGSGRFCSEHCARGFSSLEGRAEINKKRSRTKIKNYIGSEYHRELLEKAREKSAESCRRNRLKRRAKVMGQELDITNAELDDYRKTHQVCGICGKPERISNNGGKSISKLAVDHDHITKKFRGLLCCDCNRKLGWYETQKENIEKYLASSSNG